MANKGTLANTTAVESIIASSDIFAESAGWWADVCSRCRHGHPRRLVCGAAALSAIAEKPGLPRRHAATSPQGAVQANVRRFVGIGTCFEYDLSAGTLSVETPLKAVDALCAGQSGCFQGAFAIAAAARDRIYLVPAVLSLWRGRGRAPAGALCAREAQAGEPAELSSGSADPRFPRRARGRRA